MNQVLEIYPYSYGDGIWLFDDQDKQLIAEPFVNGSSEIISRLVKDIPNAEKGFKLSFSLTPFSGFQAILIWMRAENDGNWYWWATQNMDGWLCPALYKYFDKAPLYLYVKAETL